MIYNLFRPHKTFPEKRFFFHKYSGRLSVWIILQNTVMTIYARYRTWCEQTHTGVHSIPGVKEGVRCCVAQLTLANKFRLRIQDGLLGWIEVYLHTRCQ